MTDRHRFLGIGAALSDLPIPREYELDHQGSEPDVVAPQGTDDVVSPVTATSYVEQSTDDSGIRVRSYPHQSEVPIEVIFETAIGETTLGLQPRDARRVPEHVLDAVAECNQQSEDT